MNDKILLIEDDLEISEMLKSYLTAENYEVICAIDGQEACNYFDSTDFSCPIYRLGNEVLKSNDYFLFPADYINTSKHWRFYNGKQCDISSNPDNYFTNFCFSICCGSRKERFNVGECMGG